MKRRWGADHDRTLAERIRRQIDHGSIDFEPKVACGLLVARQHTAYELRAAERGDARTAREMLCE
jgi:hypothetical protein